MKFDEEIDGEYTATSRRIKKGRKGMEEVIKSWSLRSRFWQGAEVEGSVRMTELIRGFREIGFLVRFSFLDKQRGSLKRNAIIPCFTDVVPPLAISLFPCRKKFSSFGTSLVRFRTKINLFREVQRSKKKSHRSCFKEMRKSRDSW